VIPLSSSSSIPAGKSLVLLVIPLSSSCILPGNSLIFIGQKLEEEEDKEKSSIRRPRKKVEEEVHENALAQSKN